MTRTEHLLVILMEECTEVAHRVSKALRFGLAEVEPGQDKTNTVRMLEEVVDLMAVLRELTGLRFDADAPQMNEKRDKVEKFLAYSKECGTLTGD